MRIAARGMANQALSSGTKLFDAASKVPRSFLVCFSGKIASGKTSISRAVASRLDCDRACFGGYLREKIAREGGDPASRESLQNLGQRQIESDAELFCRAVLATGNFVPGEDFVLDGIRHIAVLSHLVQIAAPSEVCLIFIDAAVELRQSRVGTESDGACADFARATRHIVEADMENKLPMASHAVLDGSLSEQALVCECIELIDEWRATGLCIPSASEYWAAATKTQRR